MQSERTKPGAVLYAIFSLSLLILYVVSTGPVYWAIENKKLNAPQFRVAEIYVWPLRCVDRYGPEPIESALYWYVNLWVR